MKLLGASLLCLGLMMAESKGSKAKVRYSQPLPTLHKPPESKYPTPHLYPSSSLPFNTPHPLQPPKLILASQDPPPSRLPPWIGQRRASGQHSPSQGLGAWKGQPLSLQLAPALCPAQPSSRFGPAGLAGIVGLACPVCAQPGPWDSLTGGAALHADHTLGILAGLTGVKGPNSHCYFH